MHDLKSFAVSWHPSATFPHHSLKTAASFLRLRQYISWKELQIHFSLPPFSLVVQEGVALSGKLAVFWHGLQSGEDLLEHWPFLHHNTHLCHYRQTDIGGLTGRLDLKLCSLLAPLPSSFSWVQQNWQDSHSGWLTSERHQTRTSCWVKVVWHFTANGMKQLLGFTKLFGHKVIYLLFVGTLAAKLVTSHPSSSSFPLPVRIYQTFFSKNHQCLISIQGKNIRTQIVWWETCQYLLNGWISHILDHKSVFDPFYTDLKKNHMLIKKPV